MAIFFLYFFSLPGIEIQRRRPPECEHTLWQKQILKKRVEFSTPFCLHVSNTKSLKTPIKFLFLHALILHYNINNIYTAPTG